MREPAENKNWMSRKQKILDRFNEKTEYPQGNKEKKQDQKNFTSVLTKEEK